MNQQVTLSIPTPCPEPWAAMQPVEGGRHCASCQKIVQDFSTLSDHELATWLATYNGKNSCGRFRTDQLERFIQPTQVRSQPPGHVSWVRWAVALVLGWQTAKGQSGPPQAASVSATVSPLQTKANLVNGGRPLISPEPVFYVTGQVVDDNGKPYTEVVIQNESAGVSVPVDKLGKFRLPIYASDQKKDTIRVGVICAYRQYKKVSTKQEQTPLLITVYPPAPERNIGNIVGGGFLVVRREPVKRRSFWQFLSGKR